jgi:hypothetical protein
MAESGLTCLVTVTPEEVLGADVLVGVLGAPLLEGGLVGKVLPVGIPPNLSIDARNNQAWDSDVDGQLAPEF